MTSPDRHILNQGVTELGVAVEGANLDRLIDYWELLKRWNRKIRLVGSTEGRDAIEVLLVDSLAPLLAIPHECERLVDVGSGAGLPGVVLAIARPELSVTTLEPIHKKHAFQRTAKRELDIVNLNPQAQRIEDHESTGYDVAISRATFAIEEWLRRGEVLIREEGLVVGMANRREDVPEGDEVIPYAVGGRARVIAVHRTR